jgi:hypothetical protein
VKHLALVPLLGALCLVSTACGRPHEADVDEPVSTGSADRGAVAGPLNDAKAQEKGAGDEAGAAR